MGTIWSIGFCTALILCAPASAKKNAQAPNDFLPHRNQYDQSSQHRADVASSQFPPPPPSSMLPRFPSNQEDLSAKFSADGVFDGNTALDDETWGLKSSRIRSEASRSSAQVSPKTRQDSFGTSDLAIHYDFPAVVETQNSEDKDLSQQFSSARRDKITGYMSSTNGRIQVVSSASFIGGGAGLFVAKSIIPFAANLMGVLGAAIFFVGSFFRTPFGELVRALGLSLILVLQRTSNVRKKYPTWSFCGGSIPIIPTWIGSLAGTGMCAFLCTLSSAKGDLCRTMGMRIVALLQELWHIQTELRIIPKAAVVTSQVIDKMMLFDRQHRIKDRFLSLATRAYEKITSEIQDDGGSPRSSPPTSRREDDLGN
ncbi:unnamed protein product [Cylindrotheca closterium]|uniref:Transmembrane protein n=1 Tax=Cylindrotheca closterium TaxID=2856 RepID=A0AAD2G5S8_9STRA|nr:unnamed protein product [Cylindrotheca closterium]